MRLAVFVLATAGVIASAAAAIVFTTDASLNRVYFGTDTRAQALLVGAAAAALVVRDWSTLTLGGPYPLAVAALGRPDTAVRRLWRCWRRRRTTRRAAPAIFAAGC